MTKLAAKPTSKRDHDEIDPHLSTSRVAEYYDVHPRTVDRWWGDPDYADMKFPKPDLRINGRKFWRLSTLKQWERRCAKALAVAS